MRWLVRQKFRLDIASSGLSVVNFGILLAMNNAKLCALVGLHETRTTATAVVVIGCFALWLIGYVLDKLRFHQHYMSEHNDRNEMLKDISNK